MLDSEEEERARPSAWRLAVAHVFSLAKWSGGSSASASMEAVQKNEKLKNKGGRLERVC